MHARYIEAATNLFVEDCYWRDLLTFTWNIKTMEGQAALREMLKATLSAAKPSHWQLSGEASVDDGVIEAWFSFETAVARRSAYVSARPVKVGISRFGSGAAPDVWITPRA